MRLALNLAQSARARHETYVGPWLPEPVDTSTDAQLGAERGEALEFGSCCCSKNSRLRNEQPMFCGKPSIIHIGTLPKFFNWKKRTLANWSAGLASILLTVVAHRSVLLSNAAFSKPLSPQLRREISRHWKISLHRMCSYYDGGGVVRAARTPIAGRERVAKFISACQKGMQRISAFAT